MRYYDLTGQTWWGDLGFIFETGSRSICSPGWLRAYRVGQIDLKLNEIPLQNARITGATDEGGEELEKILNVAQMFHKNNNK